MADTSLPFRLAGALAGLPFGPMGMVTGALVGPTLGGVIAPDKKEPKVGTVLSYLDGKPFKVFAGPWGAQSVESYESLRAKNPGAFPAVVGSQAETPKGSPSKPPGSSTATPPATSPDWTQPAGGSIPSETGTTGTVPDIATEGFPTQAQTVGRDPYLDELLRQQRASLSPEFLKSRTDEAIRQFAATSAITQALGAQKSEERRRREVELAKINQWTELAKSTMQTNVLSQAMLGQAVIASQQPSAAVADVLSKGTAAAAQVLGAPSLRIS